MTTISTYDYISNLIAGRSLIGKIFNYVDDARYIVSIGGNKQYKITIPTIGTECYNACELVKLDRYSFCNSIDTIANSVMILDVYHYVALLLKGKSTILCLYQAYHNALDKADTGGSYCYIYRNPFGIYANVSKNVLQLSGAGVIDLFMKNTVSGIQFNASLLFSV